MELFIGKTCVKENYFAESSDPVDLKAGTYEDKTALQLTPAKVAA